MLSASFYTKIGLLSISEANGSIVSLNWEEKEKKRKNNAVSRLIKEARRQVEAFLDGNLVVFNLPLSPTCSLFQRKVYNQLSNICYGKVRTYGDIAKSIHNSPRAVGNACASNPIPIIIPCHRVLSKTSLGGYSGIGGVETKRFLLDLERNSLKNKVSENKGNK